MTQQNEEAPTLKKDVVPGAYRERYAATGGTNGDFIAKKLQEITKDGETALGTVMKENDIPVGKWNGFNVGMKRMNLSNVLRSRFLNGGTITMLGKEYDIKQMLEETGLTLDEKNDKSFDRFFDKIGLTVSDRTRATVRKTFFGPWPKTPEQRAEEKAEKAKAKEAEKAEKAAAKAKEKADRDAAKAKEKAEKAAAKEKEKADRAAAKEASKAAAAKETADAKADA